MLAGLRRSLKPADSTCESSLTPNPDISGVGVITAFLASAWLVLAFALYAYWAGLVPESSIGTLDRIFFRVRWRADDDRASRVFQEGIRAFSDQQIVTGLAILIAGYAGINGQGRFNDISIYHWQIVIYLAWMSSAVHLLTMSVLRSYFHRNRFVMIWRVTGMLLLGALLFAGLIPAASDRFIAAATFGEDLLGGDVEPQFKAGTPVRCVWIPGDHGGWSRDGILSMAILVGSYSWKLMTLFRNANPVTSFLRGSIGIRLKLLIHRQARREENWPTWMKSIPVRPYCLLVALYAYGVIVHDIWESFAASLLLMAFAVSYGSEKVLLPLFNINEVDGGEAAWTFGQIVPLVLLALPLLTGIEHLQATWKKGDDSGPFRAEKLSASSTPEKRSNFSNTFDLPVSTALATPSISPQHQFLYTSRMFRFMTVLIHLEILTILITLLAAPAMRTSPTLVIGSVSFGFAFISIVVGFAFPSSRLSR